MTELYFLPVYMNFLHFLQNEKCDGNLPNKNPVYRIDIPGTAYSEKYSEIQKCLII